MTRRAYSTPLLVGMLALAACPSDDVSIDTEGTSTGETTEDPTPMPTTTMMPTTVDPDTSTSVDPDTSSSGGEVCEPACAAGECCVGGFCFGAPEPVCPGGCGQFESCLCPEGSDPCDCEASCVLCGVEGPGYDPCLDMECPDGSVCVTDDPTEPTLGWCAQQDCGTDSCACPLPGGEATAVPTCGEFAGDGGNGSCFLDCSADGAACPEGMLCRTVEGVSACVWGGEGIESDCCFAHATPGCDDPTCEAAVCGADAFCCDTEWDQICTDSVPGLCPGLCPGAPDPEPQYGDCINGGGCDAGLTCISDGAGTFGWCATLDCADDVPCQPPPATGDAPAVCLPINMDTNACLLDCSMGQTCPDGMTCFDSFACVWEEMVPPPPVLPNYGDCADNPVETCQPGEDACIDAGTAAGCSQSGCVDAAGCPVAPATGDAPVACGDLGSGNTCYLDCAGGQTCPDGTVCTVVGAASACLWPDDGFLLDEDFEIGAFRPGWSVLDVDGNTPDAAVSFVTDAFVVTDEFEAGANFGAYSTSWYAPAGQSDDWMITPQITLGASSDLSWDGLAPDPMFADGYEVRISTAMPIPADFMANPPLFTIADEADAFTPHTVDLAAAGYMNEAVYIAFRNNSNDEFILVIDNVQITE